LAQAASRAVTRCDRWHELLLEAMSNQAPTVREDGKAASWQR
jgi:hypothetical protein